MKLLAPKWQMMSDPQLTGYFANFMVEVSREHIDELEVERAGPYRHRELRGSSTSTTRTWGPDRPGRPARHGSWRAACCCGARLLREAVNQGLRVIRYDNPDVGLPPGRRPPHRRPAAAKDGPLVPRHAQPGGRHAGGHGRRRRGAVRPSGHRQGYIVGASMGGMIAQVFAARHRLAPDSCGDLLEQQPAGSASPGPGH